ncbi:L-seryl-tRNA(Sec) selenium transferase [Limosilactobacillus sp.]|uniref:L-seryl-tRNA(Sec) selenium transferase n=1 Tax=Limosilactobacillus sp. TaxID=2773925 RepID=UPI003EFD3D2C
MKLQRWQVKTVENKQTQVELLRQIPAVNDLIQDDQIQQLIAANGDREIKKVIDQVLNTLRQQILAGQLTKVSLDQVVKLVLKQTRLDNQLSLRPVINGTGVILHTNLGRSLLSPAIKDYLNQIMFSYSNLEYKLAAKKRGLRYHHIEKLLCELTGAEDALVVNNNAAAVMLTLDTLVPNKEVIVSRGELVEIGGSFRVPEIITKGGGTLREVGTTNKTHLRDYKEAITEETGAILKVHTSNYRIIGFTEKPDPADLQRLAHEAGIPMINDLGSGLLIDLSKYGLPREPLIQEAVATSDIVTFSGDKLLGGPQAGVIAGKRQLIEQIKHNQLLRALRVDKMTLAALAATLQFYRNPTAAIKQIPTLRMITVSSATLATRAQQLANKLAVLPNVKVTVQKGSSQVGGGSFPGYELPTSLVCLTFTGRYSATKMEELLRTGEPPIIARLEHDQIIFDVRTLQAGDGDKICTRISELMKEN